VVGRIGKNTPTAPNPKEIVPVTMNIAFLRLLGLRLPSGLFIKIDYALGLVNLAITRRKCPNESIFAKKDSTELGGSLRFEPISENRTSFHKNTENREFKRSFCSLVRGVGFEPTEAYALYSVLSPSFHQHIFSQSMTNHNLSFRVCKVYKSCHYFEQKTLTLRLAL